MGAQQSVTGECTHCGQCCRESPFEGIPVDADGYCREFDRDAMRCGIYNTRPEACRHWPAGPDLLALERFYKCTLTFTEVTINGL